MNKIDIWLHLNLLLLVDLSDPGLLVNDHHW